MTAGGNHDGRRALDEVAGEYLRQLRENAELSQQALAELAGIDRSVYNSLENGRRRISDNYAARIAPWLNLPDPALLRPPEGEAPPSLDVRLRSLEELVGQALGNQQTALLLLEEIQNAVADAARASEANGRLIGEIHKSLAPARRRRASQ